MFVGQLTLGINVLQGLFCSLLGKEHLVNVETYTSMSYSNFTQNFPRLGFEVERVWQLGKDLAREDMEGIEAWEEGLVTTGGQHRGCSYENINLCFRKKIHLSCFSFDHCSFKDVANKKHFVGEIDALQNQVALYLESESRRFV